MYRLLNPEAYEAGHRDGLVGKFDAKPWGAGAQILFPGEENSRTIAYSAYNEGHCAGEREHWLATRLPGEGMLAWWRRLHSAK